MSYSSSGYNTNTSSTTDTSSTATTSTTVTSTASTVSTVTPAVNTASTVTQTSTSTDGSLFPTDADIGDRVVVDSVTWEFGSTGWTVVSEGPAMRFPSNPMLEERYSIGNKSWEFDGEKWVLVYVGSVEDQDDYVKKSSVEHVEYFGVANGENLPAHDLYGEEVDNILNMLNKGPAVYSTGGSPLVVRTGRQQLIGDSSGIEGTNFQSVNLSVDLRTITSVGEIDVKGVIVSGKESPLILEPTTYNAVLSGRPSNVGYSWSLQKVDSLGALQDVLPSEAKLLPPYDRSFIEVMFREEAQYVIGVTALIKRNDSLGNVIVDSTVDNTLTVTASDALPADNESPFPRTLTNFLNPDRAESIGGYVFLKRAATFLEENGSSPNVPIMNFTTKVGNGLHFTFNSLHDIDTELRNGFFMVHEDLLNDRLRVESDENTDFKIEDFDNFLIGPSDSQVIDYGTMRGSTYLGEPGFDHYPFHYGTAAYNYRGLSILDPFGPANSNGAQAPGVSVNSLDSGDAENPLQYLNEAYSEATLTPNESEAQRPEHEFTLNSFADTSFSNSVIQGRFTRGHLKSVTEVIENNSVTTIHFFRDSSSKYFIANAAAVTPPLFTKIFIHDLWISEEMNLSLAASDKFAGTIEGAFPNYVPSAT